MRALGVEGSYRAQTLDLWSPLPAPPRPQEQEVPTLVTPMRPMLFNAPFEPYRIVVLRHDMLVRVKKYTVKVPNSGQNSLFFPSYFYSFLRRKYRRGF